jgi:hypothetical protein
MERSDTQPDEENQTETLAQEMEDSANERPERPAETKDLVTFWTKLDDVFDEIIGQFPKEEKLNKGNLKSFIYQPERISISSVDAQLITTATPEQWNTQNAYVPQETFSPFKIIFTRPLLNVKSIQLLSAIIPNPQASIPDDERVFTYYRLRTIYSSLVGVWVTVTTYARGDVVIKNTGVGGIFNYYISTIDSNLNNDPLTTNAWISVGKSGTAAAGTTFGPWNSGTSYTIGQGVFYGTGHVSNYYRSLTNANIGNQPDTSPGAWTFDDIAVATLPNYFDITSSKIKYVSMLSSVLNIDTQYAAGPDVQNTIFPDYISLVTCLNAAADDSTLSSTGAAGYPDVQFIFNETLNKIQFAPQKYQKWVNGVYNNGVYYLLTGWNDLNLKAFYTTLLPTYNTLANNVPFKLRANLNLRCGFTWNGAFMVPANPYASSTTSQQFKLSILPYIVPFPSDQGEGLWPIFDRTVITANTYADLVYTQAVSIYCDITQGSTQDSAGNSGLLSVVPMSSGQLGINFYQNNFDNPLTKIPSQLQEITISMRTQSGDDYLLPSSANVTFELAVEYHEK